MVLQTKVVSGLALFIACMIFYDNNVQNYLLCPFATAIILLSTQSFARVFRENKAIKKRPPRNSA
jgi:hypothetical protein